jgi:ethanolamine utilization protein EutN
MFLARIVGNVVATAKNPSLVGKKILIVQPIDRDGKDHGAKLLALDSVGAGAGETVYCCRGREASFPWLPDEVPTEISIVAVVDHINVAQEKERNDEW